MPNEKAILNKQQQHEKVEKIAGEYFMASDKGHGPKPITANPISTPLQQQQQSERSKNRKIFCITERPATLGSKNTSNRYMYLLLEDNIENTCHENGKEESSIDGVKKINGTCDLSTATTNIANGQKVILFADKKDIGITKRVEHFLPPILNHINAQQNGPIVIKSQRSEKDKKEEEELEEEKKAQQKRKIIQTNATALNNNLNTINNIGVKDNALLIEQRKENNNNNNISNKRARITLPPKKFLTQQILPNVEVGHNNMPKAESVIRKTPINNNNHNYYFDGEETNDSFVSKETPAVSIVQDNILKIDANRKAVTSATTTNTASSSRICAETPVIVTPASLLSKNALSETNVNSNINNNNNNHTNINNLPTSNNNNNNANNNINNNNNNNNAEAVTMKRYINLTPEFLFLMRLLPTLESIQEPRKSRVKFFIEKIITNSAPGIEKE